MQNATVINRGKEAKRREEGWENKIALPERIERTIGRSLQSQHVGPEQRDLERLGHRALSNHQRPQPSRIQARPHREHGQDTEPVQVR